VSAVQHVRKQLIEQTDSSGKNVTRNNRIELNDDYDGVFGERRVQSSQVDIYDLGYDLRHIVSRRQMLLLSVETLNLKFKKI
jgi:hypothetical protein